MHIPPWLSLSQKLRDSAVRVEILRDAREKRKMKVEAENGTCCEEHDRELMLAEIAYRDNLLSMEAAIRKVRRELKDTRIPLTPRTSLQRVAVPQGEGATAPVVTPTAGGDQRWQRMADEAGEPVIVALVKVSNAMFDREYERAVVESLASDDEKASMIGRYVPDGVHG